MENYIKNGEKGLRNATFLVINSKNSPRPMQTYSSGKNLSQKREGGNYQNAKYISLYKADIRFLSAIFPETGGGRLDAPRQSAAVSGQYKPKHRRSIKSRPLIFVFVPIKYTMK